MSSPTGGRLLSQSISFVESWIASLKAPQEAVAAAVPPSLVKKPAAKETAKSSRLPNKNGAASNATAMSRCCFAIGKIVEVSKHPESSKLYIEKIDLGPELNAVTNNEPRTILSGLQAYITEEDFLNRLVLVIANLKPRKIGGIVSNGMVMCASTEEGPHDPSSAEQKSHQVVLLDIPEGSVVGERVEFEGHTGPYEPVLKGKLADSFDEVMAEVRTNEKGEVCWKGIPFKTSAGIITAPLCNARIS
ncbi:unnamed protein product [Phytomonas sp. EM1]|nr:unnamed protein product [Phytomonas sp. EM1]|eukprot:CCW64667.1 unnamed protein product [Phytomonas sp. isolate EM1]